MSYPRDLIGYSKHPPDPKWPGGARLALQIVMNYEEGGERSILHGDTESESFLHEVVATEPLNGVRNMNVESVYEYGSSTLAVTVRAGRNVGSSDTSRSKLRARSAAPTSNMTASPISATTSALRAR